MSTRICLSVGFPSTDRKSPAQYVCPHCARKGFRALERRFSWSDWEWPLYVIGRDLVKARVKPCFEMECPNHRILQVVNDASRFKLKVGLIGVGSYLPQLAIATSIQKLQRWRNLRSMGMLYRNERTRYRNATGALFGYLKVDVKKPADSIPYWQKYDPVAIAKRYPVITLFFVPRIDCQHDFVRLDHVEDRWRGCLSTKGEDALKVASELNMTAHRAMSLSRGSMTAIALKCSSMG
jgi:hypothetical protein